MTLFEISVNNIFEAMIHQELIDEFNFVYDQIKKLSNDFTETIEDETEYFNLKQDIIDLANELEFPTSYLELLNSKFEKIKNYYGI